MSRALGKQWYVVYAQAKLEAKASMQLHNQGFETYLPLYKKLSRHARKTREVKAPLFPRYFFIELDLNVDRWRCVNSTRGVSSLVMTNPLAPQFVSQEVIENLRSQEDNDGLVSLASLELFKQGDQVRIIEGPFKDRVAIFKKMSDQHRVEVFLNFLNKDVCMQIEACAVEKAA